jgi:hypothetical protein
MSLGEAAGLTTGALSSGAALAPTLGLLLPPPHAAKRAVAPRAMAISVLRIRCTSLLGTRTGSVRGTWRRLAADVDWRHP